jgi:hypothetical protein
VRFFWKIGAEAKVFWLMKGINKTRNKVKMEAASEIRNQEKITQITSNRTRTKNLKRDLKN